MTFSIVLLDVEGTTTPVDFVYGTLFPFAAERLPEYLYQHHDDDTVRKDLEMLEAERRLEKDASAPEYSTGKTPLPYLQWLIKADRKSPALKSLQGKIWEAGYKDGTLRGDVYSDVRPALQRWNQNGSKVCIYSSGSVLAQKLLFQYSVEGDLTPHLSGHFDTAVGPKGDARSYEGIAQALGVSPEEILFVSDVLSELSAASTAGCQCVLSVRPGNKAVSEHTFRSITSFDSI